MSKFFSLLRASMSEGMNIFRLSGKKQSKFSRIGVPIILAIIIMVSVAGYVDMMMEPLAKVGMEFVVLTIFVIFGAIFILVEGVYKANGLLFNCRDDDMLLALPVKRTTVLVIRVLKFYLFEVMANALILIPAIVIYAIKVDVPASFCLVSLSALFILPILPIIISSVIGGLISFFSAKFRYKNLVQIMLTTLVLLAVLYASFNIEDIIQALAQNAKSINELITKLYYPAGQFIRLVLNFKFLDYLMFIVINVGIFVVVLWVFGGVYYKINSRVKIIRTSVTVRDYHIKTHSPLIALVRKELRKFTSSPVFIINAGFGLVLFVVAVVLICINMNSILEMLVRMETEIPIEKIIDYMPAILFGLIFFTSMMSSITSSMISLEGKSFNILKSLPTSPMMIIFAKVLTAVIIIVPVLLVGDIIMFIKFNFNIWQILMIIASSIIMPILAEIVGIIVNLKYPKMDAKSDTEIVKQSMSSMVAVFVGMAASIMMIYIIYNSFNSGASVSEVVAAGLVFGVVALFLVIIYLVKWGVKEFNSINV